MRQKICGIYKIVNVYNEKSYIGSSIDIHDRWLVHRKSLNRGNHHSIKLQRAWNKYGEDSFVFIILETCNSEFLLDREEYYLISQEPKYNVYLSAGSTLGTKKSTETIEKHRQYAISNNIKPPLVPTKKVTMLDYHTSEELETFDSITKACERVGKDYNYVSCISAVCNGKRKSAFKYRWKWA